jgi:hypothetical protein
MQGRTQQKTDTKNYSYWPWIKAGGVFAFTTLGFFGLKASGILSQALAWLFPQQNSKENALVNFSKNPESDFNQLNEVSSDEYSHVSLMGGGPYYEKTSPQICNDAACLTFIDIFQATDCSYLAANQGLALTQLSNKNLILSYQKYYLGGSIYGQIFSPDIKKIGDELLLTDLPDGMMLKQVISSSQENFLITSYNISDYGSYPPKIIKVQFFTNNGTEIATTTLYNSVFHQEYAYEKIIEFNGKFLAITCSDQGHTPGEDWWNGQIFSNKGIQENQFQLFPVSELLGDINIATLSANNFILTTSGIQGYSNNSIQIFNSNGTLYQKIDTPWIPTGKLPAITNTENGFLVVWTEYPFYPVNNSAEKFHGQFFASSNEISKEFTFNIATPNQQGSATYINYGDPLIVKTNTSEYLLAYDYSIDDYVVPNYNFSIQGFDGNGLSKFLFTLPDFSDYCSYQHIGYSFNLKSFQKIDNDKYIINVLAETRYENYPYPSSTGLIGFTYLLSITPISPPIPPDYSLLFGLLGGGVGLIAATTGGVCLYKKCKKDHALEYQHRTVRNFHKSSVTPRPTETRTTKFKEEEKKESFSLPPYAKESPSAPPLQSEEPGVPPSYEETNKADDTCKSSKNKSAFFSNNKVKDSADPFINVTSNGETIYKNSRYEWRKVAYDHSLKEWAEQVDCDEAKFDADLVCPIKMRPMYDALSYNIKGSSDLQTISEEAALEWFSKPKNLCPKTGKEVTAISINSTVRNIVAHKFEDMKRQPTNSV